MPWTQPEEEIEKIIVPQIGQRWDGTIVELYENYAHVRLTGSRQIKRDCKIAAYIEKATLRTGQRVRLLADDQGHPYISATFEPCGKRGGLAAPESDCETPNRPSGLKVKLLPDLIGDGDEWSITWNTVEGADYYILYVATNTSGSGKTEIGSFDSGYASVPVAHMPSSNHKYFGVVAVQGEDCYSSITYRRGTDETTPVVIPPPGGGVIPPDYINTTRLYVWHDLGSTRFRGSGAADWTIKNGSLTGSDINDWQGGLDPWWKVKQASEDLTSIILLKGNVGKIHRTINGGDAWTDVTPGTDPPNTWSDSPAPTAADLTYICRTDNIHQNGHHYWLCFWENDKGDPRAWLLKTDDDCDTFTWKNLSITDMGGDAGWVYPTAAWMGCGPSGAGSYWNKYNDGNLLDADGATAYYAKESSSGCTPHVQMCFIFDFNSSITNIEVWSKTRGDMSNRLPSLHASNDSGAASDCGHASWTTPGGTLGGSWYSPGGALVWKNLGIAGAAYQYIRARIDGETGDSDGVELHVDTFRARDGSVTLTDPTQVYPIWMDTDSEDGTLLYITTWDDIHGLCLQIRDADDLSLISYVTLDDAATLPDIQAFTKIAYPFTPYPNKDVVFCFGRMTDPGDLTGTYHVVRSDDGGTSWTSIIDSWSSDYCAALQAWHDGFTWRVACFRNLAADVYAEYWTGSPTPTYVADAPFKVSVDAMSILPSEGKIAIGALEDNGSGLMVAESIDAGVNWNDLTDSHPTTGKVTSVLYV